jgi:hypothetical protein
MIGTVVGGQAVCQVETLHDGSMGSLSIAVDPDVELSRIAIDDGLIARDPSVAIGGYEFKGQLVRGGVEILFTIVSRVNGVNSAISVARQSPVVKALIQAGWVLREVWRVQGDEF